MTWYSLFSRISYSKPGSCNLLILKHVLFNQVSDACVWTRKTRAIQQPRLAQQTKTEIADCDHHFINKDEVEPTRREIRIWHFKRDLKMNNRMPPKKAKTRLDRAALPFVFWRKRSKEWDFGGQSEGMSLSESDKAMDGQTMGAAYMGYPKSMLYDDSQGKTY